MFSSHRLASGGRLLSVVAVSAALAMASWMGPAKPGPSDDDGGGGLGGIPGIGKEAISCGVAPSNPRDKNSCNHSGGNGADGANGNVHRSGTDGDGAAGSEDD